MVLFASALAGRPLTLADAPPQRGAVPPADTLWRPPPADWPAMRLALLRQLVCATRAHAAAAEAAAARPLLARIYRLLQAAQADVRVARRFPGARPALQRAREVSLQGLPPRLCLLRLRLGRLQQLLLGAPMQADDAWAAPAAVAGQAEAEPAQLLQAAQALLARLDPRDALRARRGLSPAMLEIREVQGPGTAGCPGGEGQAGDGGDEASTEPLGAGTQPPQPAQTQSAAGGSPTAAADAEPADATDGEPAATDAAPPRMRPRGTGQGAVVAHDEWDFRARRYRPGWAWVHELRPAARDLQFLAQLRQRHGPLTQRIRRRIAHVRAAQRERLHRSPDGEEIDLDAAIEAHAERRAGRAGEGRVYTAHQPARRDVCAAFLLDISGSTGFQVPDPAGPSPDADEDAFFHAAPSRAWQVPPPRRRVIDVAHDAIGLMCDALAQLGDRHAVYGFSGEGRQRVEFHRAKDFDEAWSARSAAALAAMQPSGSTRTGAALRHAARQLAHQPARTRLLILVTDGYPQDSDYGDRPDDLDYGLRDTAMALREAERQGIAAFCVCIDHAAHDHLRRVCPPARYMVIDEVDALPEQLAKVYRRLVSGP